LFCQIRIIKTFKIKAEFEIIPYSKQLHLTLAYNFEPEHKRVLEDLAVQHINYRNPSDWEIRLYSRDSRVDSKLVSLILKIS
jgi:ubiquitin-associated SH3 domain-containing protein